MNGKICSLCGQTARIQSKDQLDRIFQINCDTCGHYSITDRAIEMTFKDQGIQTLKVKISSYIKERCLKKLSEITIFHTDNEETSITPRISIKEIFSSHPDVSERIDKALLNLGVMTEFAGGKVRLLKTNYPIFYPESVDLNASFFILGQLIEDGFISGNCGFPTEVVVTPKGWSRISHLQRGEKKNSIQGFTAMWFDKSMDSIWNNSIKKAIEDAGFVARRIDNKEHNNKICDEIIAEVRKSKFVVCDFTGQRGGVYFEAGFALGLGIPVIWSCKDTKEELENLHFDTRQYNHILWNDEEDLYKKLFNRIEATIY
jgi:hypothetical protein